MSTAQATSAVTQQYSKDLCITLDGSSCGPGFEQGAGALPGHGLTPSELEAIVRADVPIERAFDLADLVAAVSVARSVASLARLAYSLGRGALKAAARRAREGVEEAAERAYKHGYKYDSRVRARGVQDPKAHNFPHSFDDEILRTTPIRQADGSLLYRRPGTLNGKDGFYELGVNQETQTIFHRTFVGIK